jgi:lauroyl/myristoyl acyltransferase/SAM-dependent methyltransferase
MSFASRFFLLWRKGLWRAAVAAHHLDFAWLLPAMARLPLQWGYRLASLRGRLNARTGRDWRSMALGMRHIQRQSLAGYRLLSVPATEDQRLAWNRQRFVVEARDEFEAALVAAGRTDELTCRFIASNGHSFATPPPQHKRGLLLLTPHFDSFFVGVAFAARGGAKVNLMSSAVTQDPRVIQSVQRHFSAKYRGLEPSLNGGVVLDMERGIRPFYRMLERGETLVVLGDAPVLPQGVSTKIHFLGDTRLLAGGALRLAQTVDCDLGGYICRMEKPGEYVMEWCDPGPANDPRTVQRVYDLFTAAIEKTPGRWWAADLLPAMPACAPPPPDYSVLLFTNSPLEESQELACGLQLLQRQWPGTAQGLPGNAGPNLTFPTGWYVTDHAMAPRLEQWLTATATRFLLVILDPALLGTADLPQKLAQCLEKNEGALCALADDARFASGEWTPAYSTQADFERYVAHRSRLPAHTVAQDATTAAPLIYMLELDRLRALGRQSFADWRELPQTLGTATILAPRAFVHSFADYQQGHRLEMLDLLPDHVGRLLDVGGGEGGFAHAFMEHRNGVAVLVEPSAKAACQAQAKGLDVLEADFEHIDPESLAPFDAVSFLDVLEHLVDPRAMLSKARTLLVPNGFVLISVPNVGYWPVVRDLANGRFDYLPVGILCQSHLRFFTADSLEQLLEDAGFELVQLRRHCGPPSPELEKFIQLMESAGLPCDRNNLATESLHALARIR